MTEAAISLMATTSTPVIVHVHGLYNLFRFSRFPIAHRVFPWIYEACYPALFSRCAKVLGTGSAEEYETFFRTMRIMAGARISTCARTGIFRPLDREALRTRLNIGPQEKVVLFAGRMTDVKNIPLLLDSFREVSGELPDLKLVLAGDGPLRSEIERMAASLGNVTFTGMLDAGQLSEWMNAADVLALTSRIEGFPTTVIEALSCGLPVVATPVKAASELIRQGVNGAVAEGHTVAAYSSALASVLRHPPQRLDCVASVRSYTPEAVSRKIIGEIDEVFTPCQSTAIPSVARNF